MLLDKVSSSLLAGKVPFPSLEGSGLLGLMGPLPQSALLSCASSCSQLVVLFGSVVEPLGPGAFAGGSGSLETGLEK